MAVNIWGVTHTEVRNMLPGLSIIDAPQTSVEECIKRAHSHIKGRLPAKYREMMTHVPGELFDRCTSGQTTFTLSLDVASSTGLLVWVSPYTMKRTLLRGDSLASTEWSLTDQVLTIPAGVEEDGWVVVDYSHDGQCLEPSADTDDWTLYDMLLKRSAFELGNTKFQETKGGEIVEYVKAYADEVKEWLDNLISGHVGIPIFDDVNLYEDWSGPASSISTCRLVRG